jgi:hypothetical protein
MRWLVTLVLLTSAALSAAGQENQAEKLYRGMEKTLRTAKTLRVSFDLVFTPGPSAGAENKPLNVKGVLLLGEGDMLRLEFAVGAVKLLTVSDGTNLARSAPDPARAPSVQKTPKGLGSSYRSATALVGLGLAAEILGGARDFFGRPPEHFTASDFKLGAKERVGKVETQIIEYSVTEKSDDQPRKGRVKVWLDMQTKLPLKLSLTTNAVTVSAITELYREFTLNPTLEEKVFALPK